MLGVWRWLYKSLFLEPLALIMAIASISGAFLLIILYESVFVGESAQIVSYVKNVKADIWVMQKGVSNMHMATSFLPDWKERQIGEIEGVAQIDSILYLNTVVGSGEGRWFSYVVGIKDSAVLGGPWSMVAGKRLPEPGEVVVPEVFAKMSDIAIGGQLKVTDKELTVVGLSEGTFSMANSVIFINKYDLEEIMSALDITSFILVKGDDLTDSVRLAKEIEHQLDNVSALPAEKFLTNDWKMAMQMGTETIAMMNFIGGGLAILLVSFTIYTMVARQRRELAAAKAIGLTNRMLYLGVVLQALAITLCGVFLAFILAAVIVPVLSDIVPAINMKLSVETLFRITLIGFLIAIVSALAPTTQIARIDAITAFQSRG
jgi:putative ABC transport system permease protein